jgi:Spy/CpxP family protein refolding chaperone
MYSMLKMAVLGCALLMVAPWLNAADDQPAKGEKHGKHGDMLDGILGKLNLTDDQKSKIEALKTKFHGEMQEFQKAHKDEIDAAKQAKDRAKMHEIMKPFAEKRDAFMNDIKGVLTDDQKAQLQKAMDDAKAAHGKHGDNK